MVMAGQQSECKYAKETVHLKIFKMVNFVLCMFYHKIIAPQKSFYGFHSTKQILKHHFSLFRHLPPYSKSHSSLT